MFRFSRRLLAAHLIAAAIVGCSDGATAPDDPQDPGAVPPPSDYVVRGAATDTKGRPLTGVAIVIDNTIYYNSAVTGRTGDDGSYRLTIGDGSWRAYATMQTNYNGRTYEIDLHPDNDDSFSGVSGAVRNFRWRLTGAASEFLGKDYYGGTVDLLRDPSSDYLDIEHVEFTFVPEGALIDGSTGQTLVGRSGAPRTDTFSKIVDVPIGRYRVSAVYAAPGEAPQALVIRVEGDPGYGDSVLADFIPEGFACRNCMRLEVNWP